MMPNKFTGKLEQRGNPVILKDPDGSKIVPGNLSESEKKAFNTTIKVLRKNNIFNKVYGQVNGSEEYLSINRTDEQDFVAIRNEYGRFRQARDGRFWVAGSSFNKHTIRFKQKDLDSFKGDTPYFDSLTK